MPDFYWHLLGQLLIIVRFIYRYLLSSYQQVLSDMSENSHQCVIIGIAGASASGKSLIASTVYNELKEKSWRSSDRCHYGRLLLQRSKSPKHGRAR